MLEVNFLCESKFFWSKNLSIIENKTQNLVVSLTFFYLRLFAQFIIELNLR